MVTAVVMVMGGYGHGYYEQENSKNGSIFKKPKKVNT
jgi:hypothetical protein